MTKNSAQASGGADGAELAGLTDVAIERAKLVAGDRYVVFVADMYGQGTRPADFGEAAALRQSAARERARAARSASAPPTTR